MKFKYLGTVVTSQYYVNEGVRSGLNSGDVYCHTFKNYSAFRALLTVRNYNVIFLFPKCEKPGVPRVGRQIG